MAEEPGKIKIFTSDDKSLKILGELLANDTSRKILQLLIQREAYTNDISTSLDIRVSLVIHHLKKIEELGLVDITEKQIVRKGNKHRYFKMVPHLFISPNQTKEELENKGFFKRIFKEGIKFMVVGIAGTTTLLGMLSIPTNKILVNRGSSNDEIVDIIDILSDFINTVEFFSIPIVSTSIVISCGLFLIFMKERKKD